MGTRHMIFVELDGKYHVAQYGQWDGYPDGAGVDLLGALRLHSLSDIRDAMEKARFISKKEYEKAINNIIGDSAREFLNEEQLAVWKEKFPLFSRDIGGEILHKIMECAKKNEAILLYDQTECAQDSLNIEWGYVINLDKNLFEVYKGLNRLPLDSSERFFTGRPSISGYYPIRHMISFPLDQLPDDDEFLAKVEIACKALGAV